jgi:hypothetical protein
MGNTIVIPRILFTVFQLTNVHSEALTAVFFGSLGDIKIK